MPPKRLFHVPTMSTVLYKDVADDVGKKGYVAISHVWGNSKDWIWCTAEQMGITGVDWKIPLSDTDKMTRIKSGMEEFGKEYCWFDVLCMPQGEDRQWEVNLEIPYMGDYYTGADMTFVLAISDYVVPEDFATWYKMASDAMEENRGLTRDEEIWVEKLCLDDVKKLASITEKSETGEDYAELMDLFGSGDLIDLSKELWFTRVWTYQEAILSKKFILVGSKGNYINLSDIAERVQYLFECNMMATMVFKRSVDRMRSIQSSIRRHKEGTNDLVDIIADSFGRQCFKPQDKFYGALGVLGYKDFPVDYDISMDNLNKAIAKHAYSKGDISWVLVGGNAGDGFIQPMYEKFTHLSGYWKEDEPGICRIKFVDDELYMDMLPFGKICASAKFSESGLVASEFTGWMVRTFRDWGVDEGFMAGIVTNYIGFAPDEYEACRIWANSAAENKSQQEMGREVRAKLGDGAVVNGVITVVCNTADHAHTKTIARIIYDDGNELPIIVYGDADVGDEIGVLRISDSFGRSLGIIVSGNKRKGICYFPKYSGGGEYKTYKFPI
jgi:hypothetical protein